MLDDQLEALAADGFDIAHRFDARAIASERGWEVLSGEQQLGILVGNTRRLWPVFCEAMRDPALATHANPLEHYLETSIAHRFTGARVYYSHRTYDGAYLPFRQLAVATGLGAASAGGLVIHPIYGPWLALRAVIVVDGAPVARAPIAKPCTCEARCATSLEAALASNGDWRAWLAMRDSCTLREWRYSEHQLRYHYTKIWEP